MRVLGLQIGPEWTGLEKIEPAVIELLEVERVIELEKTEQVVAQEIGLEAERSLQSKVWLRMVVEEQFLGLLAAWVLERNPLPPRCNQMIHCSVCVSKSGGATLGPGLRMRGRGVG